MAQILSQAHYAFLLEHGLRRITRRDPSLPCQIVITRCLSRNGIAVSCNCRRIGRNGCDYEPIEVRPSWEPGEAMAAWRDHLREAGAVAL